MARSRGGWALDPRYPNSAPWNFTTAGRSTSGQAPSSSLVVPLVCPGIRMPAIKTSETGTLSPDRAQCRYVRSLAYTDRALAPGRTGKVDRAPRRHEPHPNKLLLVWKLGSGMRDLVLAMLWAAPRQSGEDRALSRGEHWPRDRAPPARKARVSALTGDDRCREKRRCRIEPCR
jgi:hypothetical protein